MIGGRNGRGKEEKKNGQRVTVITASAIVKVVMETEISVGVAVGMVGNLLN